MGNIRPTYIKRVAAELLDKFPEEFNDEFEHNKLTVEALSDVDGKVLRNRIAGYITRRVVGGALEDKLEQAGASEMREAETPEAETPEADEVAVPKEPGDEEPDEEAAEPEIPKETADEEADEPDEPAADDAEETEGTSEDDAEETAEDPTEEERPVSVTQDSE